MAKKDLLYDAVKESLTKSGHLNHFKAQLRSDVFSVLCDGNKHAKPHIPSETKFINELIREYLLWNGYKYTQDMFVTETGMQNEPPNREFMTAKLGVVDDISDDNDGTKSTTNKIPLLYHLLNAFQNDT